MQTRTIQQLVMIGISLLLISTLSACSKGPDDATLTTEVKTKLLADNPTAASAINVETKDGVVTLSGMVDSEASRSRAEQAAKSVLGVQSVANNLTVKPAPTPMVFAEDTTLKKDVEANLTKYGVKGITVEVANGEVTLKGDIARAKLQDAMKAANEAKPKKVNNQMNIK
jgi:osmotically-inducible protein OsmY